MYFLEHYLVLYWTAGEGTTRHRLYRDDCTRIIDDDQGGDIPAWMFRKSNQEKTEKSALKKRNSKKKKAQPKENDDHARRNGKVKEV